MPVEVSSLLLSSFNLFTTPKSLRNRKRSQKCYPKIYNLKVSISSGEVEAVNYYFYLLSMSKGCLEPNFKFFDDNFHHQLYNVEIHLILYCKKKTFFRSCQFPSVHLPESDTSQTFDETFVEWF